MVSKALIIEVGFIGQFSKTDCKKVGWTVIPLDKDYQLMFEGINKVRVDNFQGYRNINRFLTGRFKLPLHDYPVDLENCLESLPYSSRVQESFVFVNLEFGIHSKNYTKVRKGQFMAKLYNFPYFHLKNDFSKVRTTLERKQNEFTQVQSENGQLKKILENQRKRIEELELLESQKINELFNIEKKVLKGLRKDPFRDGDDIEDDMDEEELFEHWRMIEADLQGLRVHYKSIRGVKEKTKLTVNTKVLFNEALLEDDIFQEMDFNLDYFSMLNKKKRVEKLVDLGQELNFVANIPKLLELFYRFERNIFLIFSLHNGQKIVAWSLLKLGLDDIENEKYLLNLGEHNLDWWKPPINFDLINEEQSNGVSSDATNRTIEPPEKIGKKAGFKVFLELFPYTRDDIDQYLYRDKKLEESEEGRKGKSKNLTGTLTQSLLQDTQSNFFKKNGRSQISMDIDSGLKNKLNNKSIESPFIPCSQNYLSKERFPGGEVEIYVDQVRFFPSNVTNVKMLVRVLDKNFNGRVTRPEQRALLLPPALLLLPLARLRLPHDPQLFGRALRRQVQGHHPVDHGQPGQLQVHFEPQVFRELEPHFEPAVQEGLHFLEEGLAPEQPHPQPDQERTRVH